MSGPGGQIGPLIWVFQAEHPPGPGRGRLAQGAGGWMSGRGGYFLAGAALASPFASILVATCL